MTKCPTLGEWEGVTEYRHIHLCLCNSLHSVGWFPTTNLKLLPKPLSGGFPLSLFDRLWFVSLILHAISSSDLGLCKVFRTILKKEEKQGSNLFTLKKE